MGFPVPEPFCWDVSFRTFYTMVDDQHKCLFNGIFNLAKDSSDDSLNELQRVVGQHFLDEQRLMDTSQYAGKAAHQKLHDDFIAVLAKGNVDIDYAKNWVVNHIKGVDFGYKGCL
uniref:Hemerythrin n=1 Tax=Thysanocardia nigra TaxID=210808 RepID=A0A1S6QCZ2_9ANNE|nr:hemerythrin [Thysanocardia nigra]